MEQSCPAGWLKVNWWRKAPSQIQSSQAHYTHFWLSMGIYPVDGHHIDSEWDRCQNALSTAVEYTPQEEHTVETYTVSHLRFSCLYWALQCVTHTTDLKGLAKNDHKQSINCLGSDWELGLTHCNNQFHASFWCNFSGTDEWCKRNERKV